MATTTVVFNRVNLHRYGKDWIVGYKAAQWTSFSFGVLGTSLHCHIVLILRYLQTQGTLLSLLFFRGVGAAGFREPIDEPETPNADEERTMTNSNRDIKVRSEMAPN